MNGHILCTQLESTAGLLEYVGRASDQVVAELGDPGVDAEIATCKSFFVDASIR